jgi:hypothetical protein
MYNKLFQSILDSTVWLEPDATRIVWFTLLASMDQDGFARFGNLDALAWRARESVDATKAAVVTLGAPEPSSATDGDDGRRIERVPGGWMVLNAAKYRDIVRGEESRRANRERVAAFRDRQKAGFSERIKAQDGKCDCCGDDFQNPLSVNAVADHNHKTGARRGVICQSCNRVVGLIELGKATDSPKRSICDVYIKRHGNAPVMQSDADADAVSEETTAAARPDLFEEFRKAYPKRAGNQPWSRARKAWSARTKEGHSALDMIAGANRYAVWARATGKEGSELVLQAATFLGPDKPFLEAWALPAPKANGAADIDAAWDLVMAHCKTSAYRKGALGDTKIDTAVKVIGGYSAIAMGNTSQLPFLKREFARAFSGAKP